MLGQLLPFIAIAAVVLLIVMIVVGGYKKAPPDTAFIISGLRKKVIVGKAGIKIPLLERLDKVSLRLIPIDVKTSNAVPTADYININVDAAVNVKISAEPRLLELASQNFLNQDTDYIGRVAREVLEGNMREIVGRMKLEEMVSDRQKFAQLVTENAKPDLEAMGLQIISFNVQNFADNNGVIDDLGIDNTEAIKKKAAIAKAESRRDIAIRQAQADKDANDARVSADTDIAKRQNEYALEQAELKKKADTKKAEADAAYKIQEQEQRKTIEVATAEANIAKQEKEVVLKQKEAEVMEMALDAEIKKKAEADKFARQQRSDADLYERQRAAEAELYDRTKKAEALKIEREKEAEALKALADAERAKKMAEADGIKAVGDAEAEAIKAKGLAEAEAMEKKADAYSKYNGAAVTQMVVEALPELAKAIAEPLRAIDKVTIIDGGGNGTSGVEKFTGNGPALMAKTIEAVKETTGFDLTEVMKAETYDAKVTKNINYSGDPAVQVVHDNSAKNEDGSTDFDELAE